VSGRASHLARCLTAHGSRKQHLITVDQLRGGPLAVKQTDRLKFSLRNRDSRPVWRNWQTRWIQNPLGATPWRFKSSHRYFFKARENIQFSWAFSCANTRPAAPAKSGFPFPTPTRKPTNPEWKLRFTIEFLFDYCVIRSGYQQRPPMAPVDRPFSNKYAEAEVKIGFHVFRMPA
jgi:hypothetical protein